MKRFVISVFAIFCFFAIVATPALAAEFEIWQGMELPLLLENGQDWFVTEKAVVKMGGDMSQPMHWTGDNNGWSLTSVEVGEYAAKKGVYVRGAGSYYMRWNLIQKTYPDIYLKIQQAYPGHQFCDRIYKSGDKTPDGYDPKGTGPAFW